MPVSASLLGQVLRRSLGGAWSVQAAAASGFCATWRASDSRRSVFIKTQPAVHAGFLHAEADGLAALAETRTVRVPAVLGVPDLDDGGAALLLEWLPFARPDPGFGTRLGTTLAALHNAACPLDPPGFGWRRDNWLGATPQDNAPCTDRDRGNWPTFFAQRRLRALQSHLRGRLGHAALCDAVDAVIETLPRLFDEDRVPRPSLIHGDLWSGNWAMLTDGTPVLYDPAVSCSDAEAELAMMELFGTPPEGFWPAYRAGFALRAGYARRRPLYQLYHLLNHVLLFGAGYVAEAHACATRVLRATR